MHHSHLIKRGLTTTAVVIAAAGFPAAADAMFLPPDPPFTASEGATVTAVAPVHRGASGGSSGFDWGDAGIGAAGVIVVGAAGAAAAGGVGRRRRARRAVLS